MAIGFGFNKAKVLSSAEKFVQQGKLQNAITEYEKVIREDPKDLTVLNTIGDLYVRVGQNDKASEYFRRVGDQYAQNGFIVKAIAIYKKLTKLAPATSETTLKLAELYTQQGLFNDARTHYMLVANQLLKNGDNNQAARIFQKVLELDPENAATQSKLADIYLKLGKKDEARSIYFSAAEALHSRGSYDAADEALGKVLSLDPHNVKALLLRGVVASDAGNPQASIQYLEQVPDLDSQPDALRALLRAKLFTGNREGVESIAGKLYTAHQDVTGINSVVEWYMEHDQFEDALKFYDRYSERFLARGSSGFLDTLYPIIGRIRNSPPSLQMMLRLLQKVGDNSHINEVMEMLAHAHVQSGDLIQARDMYKRLAELEPENPLHNQNFKQMQAKLGEDSSVRPLTAEEGSQAFMVEELVHESPEVRQSYAPTVERAIEAALTDSELFVSYNVPQKAIAPLEAALPLAPRDVLLNQRLVSLYAKAERFNDAARTCKVLSEIFAEFGHVGEAARYATAAENYLATASGTVSAPAVPKPSLPVAPPVKYQAPAPPPVAEEDHTVQEFDLDSHMRMPEAETAPAEGSPHREEVAGFEVMPEGAHLESPEEVAVHAAPQHEVDLSSEWEDMMTVESHEPSVSEMPVIVEPAIESVEAHAEEPHHLREMPVAEELPAAVVTPDHSIPPPPAADFAAVADKIQEVHFYISQGFWDIARAAITDLAEMAPGHPELASLVEEVEAAQMKAEAQASGRKPAPAATAAFGVEDLNPEPEQHGSGTQALEEPPVRPEHVSREAAPEHIAPDEPVFEVQHEAERVSPPLGHAPAEATVGASVPEFEDLVLDVPESFGETLRREPAAPAKPEAERLAASVAGKEKEKAGPSDDMLADFVLDLEESLGKEFSLDARTKADAAAAAAASAPPPAPAQPVHAMAAAAPGSTNGQMQDFDTTHALNDLLSDLQHDLGDEAAAEEEEDPETHYNLGIAFKEMGLLDEAIGELQKVCHAVDRGIVFSQPIQAYTWLAQCLVDKGVPEAAIRWYEKALKTGGLDLDSRCAIYYDLGAAFESSGDRKSALTNFMEVYSTNIDFRDVSTRIKALKS